MTVFREVVSRVAKWRSLLTSANERLNLRSRALVIAVLLLNAVTLSPVVYSSWYGDDWPNSQARYWSLWRHGSSSQLELLRDSIRASIDWAVGQGRLNGVAVTESKFLFFWFPEVTPHKYLQYLVLLLCISMFLLVVFLIARNARLTMLTGLLTTLTVQLRRDFDPHVGFSLIVPGMLVKIFIATALLVVAIRVQSRTKSTVLVMMGVFFHALALLTYEHAVYLTAIPICAAYLEARRTGRKLRAKVSIIAVSIATVLQLTFILFFQLLVASGGRFLENYNFAETSNVKSRYEFFISSRSVPLAISQMFSGLPLITLQIPRDVIDNPQLTTSVVLFGSIAILAFVVLKHQADTIRSSTNVTVYQSAVRCGAVRRILNSSSLEMKVVGLIALLMICVPGLLMALRPASYEASRGSPWDPRNTYLHVLVVELGVALMAAIIVQHLASRKSVNVSIMEVAQPQRNIWMRYFASAVALIGSLTFLHNHQVAAETGYRNLNLESWNLILQDGRLFSDLRDADMLVSPNVNDAYETNAANFYAQTGIRIAALHPTFYLYSQELLSCRPVEDCDLPDLRQETIRLQANLLKPDSESRNDWVHQTLSSGVLKSNSIWFIDFFPITPSSYVMFLGKVAGSGRGPEISAQTVRMAIVTMVDESGAAKETFKPALNSVCLSGPEGTLRIGNYSLTYWQMPTGEVSLVDGSRTVQTPGQGIDWRLLGFGICP